MIIVHYDEITGKVIQAYDSSIEEIPVPNIVLHEKQWENVANKDLWVDLVTKKLIVKDIVVTDEEQKLKRAYAYKMESDPMFFKYQRGEITKEDWLNKIEEIKQRFPYSNK